MIVKVIIHFNQDNNDNFLVNIFKIVVDFLCSIIYNRTIVTTI